MVHRLETLVQTRSLPHMVEGSHRRSHSFAQLYFGNASAAQRVALYILHQVEIVLPDNSEFDRTGRVAGTREPVIPKTRCIVPYRLNGQSLENLRIYHYRRLNEAESFLPSQGGSELGTRVVLRVSCPGSAGLWLGQCDREISI